MNVNITLKLSFNSDITDKDMKNVLDFVDKTVLKEYKDDSGLNVISNKILEIEYSLVPFNLMKDLYTEINNFYHINNSSKISIIIKEFKQPSNLT